MKKILIANRGEIALRILRACKELGLQTAAVYSERDDGALHTRYADEAVCIGPAAAASSYLSIPAILEAARRTGADAIHPGYGFLSENQNFAQAVEEAGLTFIGPRPGTIGLTGDKLAARRAARDAGLNVLPGPDVAISEAIPLELAGQVKFPVLIKAIAGGGGRGIRLANNSEELQSMLAAARKEAQAAFGDDTVYLEPLVQRARHVEVQILGDGRGNIRCLGERECSIQRRRQKLIEESPAPGLSQRMRHHLQEAALQLARSLNYRSLGTVEFLLDPSGHFYFIEVNPRIQVEHPVTEMVTGVDLVTSQLRLAGGDSFDNLPDACPRGWAIEARILAEDPAEGFLPATGEITYLKEPGGPGIRVDSALYLGMPVSADYDSLIAKLIAWGTDRDQAIRRLRLALDEYKIGGVPTTQNFLAQILDSRPFQKGGADTTYLDTFHPEEGGQEALEKEVAVAAAILADRTNHTNGNQPAAPKNGKSQWLTQAWREQMTGNV